MKTHIWKHVVLAAAVASGGAFAADANQQGGFGGDPAQQQQWEAKREAFKAKHVQAIKDALQVDANGGSQVDQILQSSEAKRKSLREDMKSQFEIVKRTAGGDATAANQFEAALKTLRADKAQLEQLHASLYDQLAQGHTPAQKAKLVVALTGFGKHHHHRG